MSDEPLRLAGRTFRCATRNDAQFNLPVGRVEIAPFEWPAAMDTVKARDGAATCEGPRVSAVRPRLSNASGKAAWRVLDRRWSVC